MNIHPLFVHFPIALLIVYALAELVYTRRARASESFTFFKGVLAIVGAGAAHVAAFFGDAAEESLHQVNPFGHPVDFNLVETHSIVANISIGIFSILAAAYVIFFMRSYLTRWPRLSRLSGWVLQTPLAPLLAFVGLIALLMTGALGTAIVYGPDIDPFVSALYHVFY